MAWICLQSFWGLLKPLMRYSYMVLRLIWKGGVPPDIAHVMAIKGQIRRDEACCLYELARKAKGGGVIVEIGSYRGLSTAALARGSLQGAGTPVYAIDPHEHVDRNAQTGEVVWRYDSRDQRAFLKNMWLAGVAQIVRPICLLSGEAVAGWNKPISLLWIDGNHEYQAARKDFEMWERFLVLGGILAFHDSIDPGRGPYRVVREILAEGRFSLTREINRISVLCKEKP